MKCKVVDLDNKAAGELELDDGIFGVEVRQDILARMVNYQLAKRRSGNHKTKGVSEIAGTGTKPFRQKGTGRARQGSVRSGIQRGGQTTFGPLPRDHGHKLTKKVRALAMKSALSAKQKDGKLVILDEAKAKVAKTKDLAQKLSKLGLTSALIIDGAELDANFANAARNIARIDVLPSQGANVYDILRRDTLVLTKQAVENLQERLK